MVKCVIFISDSFIWLVHMNDEILQLSQKLIKDFILGKMEYKEAMETAGLQSLCARKIGRASCRERVYETVTL